MHAKINSAICFGIESKIIPIEVDLGKVEKKCEFHILGLTSTRAKESKWRIISALANFYIDLPDKDITINIPSLENRSEGDSFDVGILVAILQSLRQIDLSKKYIKETLFIGTLGLDGSLNAVKGVLPIAFNAQSMGVKRILMSRENASECSVLEDVEIYGVSNVQELIEFLNDEKRLKPEKNEIKLTAPIPNYHRLNEVKGQISAKRMLQIAAAGRHNILFVGPPGSGKTMLAERLPYLMPPLTKEEILETSKIYSISKKIGNNQLITERPFRSPHHTTTYPGLIGGGTIPQPGEISLSHNGVLFLDEFTEFKTNVLESLREPLERKIVSISRAQQSLEFPSNFLLVAAMNPCPCGYLGDEKRKCTCSGAGIKNYLTKLSGPLLDRIDLQIALQSVDYESIKADNEIKIDENFYNRILVANDRQKDFNGKSNAQIIEDHCKLTVVAEEIIKIAFEKLNLTMRGYHKTLRVARTIADLEGEDKISKDHVKEALQYRSLDKTIEKWKK